MMTSHNALNSVLDNFGGISPNSLSYILNESDDADDIGPLVHDSPYVESSLLCQYLKTLKSKFSIMTLNIQSLNSKFDELISFLSNLNEQDTVFSVICLQETWVKSPAHPYLLYLITQFYHLLQLLVVTEVL